MHPILRIDTMRDSFSLFQINTIKNAKECQRNLKEDTSSRYLYAINPAKESRAAALIACNRAHKCRACGEAQSARVHRKASLGYVNAYVMTYIIITNARMSTIMLNRQDLKNSKG